MLIDGFLSGILAGCVFVIIGFAFSRDPMHLIPSTWTAALINAVVTAAGVTLLSRITPQVASAKFGFDWGFSYGVGLFLYYVVANVLRDNRPKTHKSSEDKPEPTETRYSATPGSQYEQPPFDNTHE